MDTPTTPATPAGQQSRYDQAADTLRAVADRLAVIWRLLHRLLCPRRIPQNPGALPGPHTGDRPRHLRLGGRRQAADTLRASEIITEAVADTLAGYPAGEQGRVALLLTEAGRRDLPASIYCDRVVLMVWLNRGSRHLRLEKVRADSTAFVNLSQPDGNYPTHYRAPTPAQIRAAVAWVAGQGELPEVQHDA